MILVGAVASLVHLVGLDRAPIPEDCGGSGCLCDTASNSVKPPHRVPLASCSLQWIQRWPHADVFRQLCHVSIKLMHVFDCNAQMISSSVYH